LLEASAVAGPYVLVGHSIGGAYVRSYAQRFPNSVVGMVLIDATHEDQLVRRRAAGYSPPPLPSPKDNVERTDMLAVLEELREAGWRADIPLTVIAAEPSEPGAYPGASPELVARLDAVWLELQRELASRSFKGRLMLAHGSGHYIHRDAPELVIGAIRDVIKQVRAHAGALSELTGLGSERRAQPAACSCSVAAGRVRG
jgi:pimeloyl-ACP methyl ester carboxylesterase